MFSCEFCEISKNNVFTEHLQTSASKDTGITSVRKIFENNKMGSDSFQLTSFDPFARSIWLSNQTHPWEQLLSYLTVPEIKGKKSLKEA